MVVVLPSAADVERWRGEHGDAAVVGGETRSDSVRAGLGCRAGDVRRSCASTMPPARWRAPSCSPGSSPPCAPAPTGRSRRSLSTDTIKVVDHDGTVVATPDRSTLVAVQTPQAFRAAVLRAAHAAGRDDTDDAAAVERHGGRVVTVPGEPWNRKITERDDLEWVRSWLATEVGS